MQLVEVLVVNGSLESLLVLSMTNKGFNQIINSNNVLGLISRRYKTKVLGNLSELMNYKFAIEHDVVDAIVMRLRHTIKNEKLLPSLLALSCIHKSHNVAANLIPRCCLELNRVIENAYDRDYFKHIRKYLDLFLHEALETCNLLVYSTFIESMDRICPGFLDKYARGVNSLFETFALYAHVYWRDTGDSVLFDYLSTKRGHIADIEWPRNIGNAMLGVKFTYWLYKIGLVTLEHVTSVKNRWNRGEKVDSETLIKNLISKGLKKRNMLEFNLQH